MPAPGRPLLQIPFDGFIAQGLYHLDNGLGLVDFEPFLTLVLGEAVVISRESVVGGHFERQYNRLWTMRREN